MSGACRHCGALVPVNYLGVTCGRSECQEAEYRANLARTARKRGARAAASRPRAKLVRIPTTGKRWVDLKPGEFE